MATEYYVHRKGTFVGNAPSWWAKGGNGYTAYILGAERFNEEEAIELKNSDPDKWDIYKCDEIDKRLHLVFDIQDKKRLGTDEPCGWPSGYAYNQSEITALRAKVSELESGGWISVDDRLPDSIGETVLIALENKYSGISIDFSTVDISWLRDKENQAWQATCGVFKLSEITHWQPITSPKK